MIYFDTEYNEQQVLMLVAWDGKDGWDYFDLRGKRHLGLLQDFLADNREEIFVSYALSAEIESLLRLGIDPSGMKCIDLMVECRMITMSHDSYFTQDSTLLGQMRALLGVDVKEDKAQKARMRDLILSQNTWTQEEWDEITAYCCSDIQPLKELASKVYDVHQKARHQLTLNDLLERGEYVRMSAEMDFASKGFPVYGGNLEKIYANKDRVRSKIIHSLPYYWRACYEYKKDKWTLKRDRVSQLIAARGWGNWKKTETGHPVLEADYLKELSVRIPEVAPLYTALRSLTTLNSADLSEQVVDGYVKPRTFGFAAKTGRNGLKPTWGFLLNLPSWMRMMVQPHPGMVFAGFDWSQQEIAIAACLSNDAELLAAYNSGDTYLTLGKMAGAIPEDGTKKSHPVERQLFKALQLALGYGKGVKSLGLDFYGILKDSGASLMDAQIKAQEVYTWHKLYFENYWTWINQQVKDARLNGWISTSDGWIEFVSNRTLTTQLLNFPSQATGATMMRAATKMLYAEWRAGRLPPVLCSQHDAFYFNLQAELAEQQSAIVEQVMQDAAKNLIGSVVRCGSSLYTADKPYRPENLEQRHLELWEAATNG